MQTSDIRRGTDSAAKGRQPKGRLCLGGLVYCLNKGKMRTILRKLVPVIFLLACAAGLAAQSKPEEPSPFDVREHYTKYEYTIPMRDGVKLFTSIYVPKDASRTYPFLMDRTPYSVAPYGVDNYKTSIGPSESFERSGYIFVYQDVRGRYMSEGDFVEMRPHVENKTSKTDVDDSTDMYDTIEWLLKNVPNNNGRVGIWGISYPGFFTSASIIDSHPALKAASPQAPMTDLFMGDDAYHGGAFMLAANFGFYSVFKPQHNPSLPPKDRPNFDWGTQSGYDFFLTWGRCRTRTRCTSTAKPTCGTTQAGHNTYDNYWKARNLAPHMKNIHCAVLNRRRMVRREDLSGPVRTFHAIEQNNPGIFNALVEGPWVHGGWARYDGARLGNVKFDSKTGDYFRENIQFPFFEQYLKNNGDAKLPKAYVFETGTNVWRQYNSWPPKDTELRTLYFGEKGRLSFTAPASSAQTFDEYVSDPSKPVPFIGYVGLNVPQEYMVARPALRDDASGCAHLPDRSARGRHHDCGTDQTATVRVDNRNRLRLGGEADRCLSGGFSRRRRAQRGLASRSAAEGRSRAAGRHAGISATGAGRAVPR